MPPLLISSKMNRIKINRFLFCVMKIIAIVPQSSRQYKEVDLNAQKKIQELFLKRYPVLSFR
jgi:hypothetical protein